MDSGVKRIQAAWFNGVLSLCKGLLVGAEGKRNSAMIRCAYTYLIAGKLSAN